MGALAFFFLVAAYVSVLKTKAKKRAFGNRKVSLHIVLCVEGVPYTLEARR